MKGQAIIIGGGMAGLLAARVLTGEFQQVTLVERDVYPADPVFRMGVPQARHLHNMLLRGQHILEELFPGITQKLVANGAQVGDFLQDIRFYYSSAWLPRISPSPLAGYYFCTRYLIEWQVRQELQKYGVQILEQQEVVGLLADEKQRILRGVKVRARDGGVPTQSEVKEFSADLVVDASGRDSRIVQWLEALGYPPPQELVVKPFLGYATRVYTPSFSTRRDFSGLVITSSPPHQLRGGVIWPVEGGRWWVVLAGAGKDYPPTDEQGFLAFAESLPVPDLFDALQHALPESPVYGYRRTENRWRRFRDLPDGLIILGDATCALNPVYGQGMTLAGMGAMLLRDLLRAERKVVRQGFALRFQDAQAKMLRLPWQLASVADYRVPGMETRGEDGKSGQGSALVRRYFEAVNDVLPSSPLVSLRFMEVIQLLRSPAALFHPAIAVRVCYHRVRHRMRKACS